MSRWVPVECWRVRCRSTASPSRHQPSRHRSSNARNVRSANSTCGCWISSHPSPVRMSAPSNARDVGRARPFCAAASVEIHRRAKSVAANAVLSFAIGFQSACGDARAGETGASRLTLRRGLPLKRRAPLNASPISVRRDRADGRRRGSRLPCRIARNCDGFKGLACPGPLAVTPQALTLPQAAVRTFFVAMAVDCDRNTTIRCQFGFTRSGP